SGCRSPALASSTICLAMIPFAKSSASPRAARVLSSATWRARLVSGSASKSSKWEAIAMAKPPPKPISSVRRLVLSAIYSQRRPSLTGRSEQRHLDAVRCGKLPKDQYHERGNRSGGLRQHLQREGIRRQD